MTQKASFNEAKAHTRRLLELFGWQQRPESRLAMDNIVFDCSDGSPLLMMHIIDGCIFLRGDDIKARPDAYRWLNEEIRVANNRIPIGMHSVQAALNYAAMVEKIRDANERELFTDLLMGVGKNLWSIHSKVEHSMVIIVTEEMTVERGIKAVYSSYDFNQLADGIDKFEPTPIKVGDALVLDECSFGTAVHVVDRDEHEITYITGHI